MQLLIAHLFKGCQNDTCAVNGTVNFKEIQAEENIEGSNGERVERGEDGRAAGTIFGMMSAAEHSDI